MAVATQDLTSLVANYVECLVHAST